ncbi:hypothetical protein J7643_00715 [bacterium]|nr:hypothetical protein [bacterium]
MTASSRSDITMLGTGLSDRTAQLWRDYLEREARNDKRAWKVTLDAFLQELTSQPLVQQQAWAENFCSVVLAHSQQPAFKLRHPLTLHLVKLLIPEAKSNNPRAVRWLGQLEHNHEVHALLVANGLPDSALELFELAIALDPEDLLSRDWYISGRLQWLWHDYGHLTCSCCPHPDQDGVTKHLRGLLKHLADLDRYRNDDKLPDLGASIDELEALVRSHL